MWHDWGVVDLAVSDPVDDVVLLDEDLLFLYYLVPHFQFVPNAVYQFLFLLPLRLQPCLFELYLKQFQLNLLFAVVHHQLRVASHAVLHLLDYSTPLQHQILQFLAHCCLL